MGSRSARRWRAVTALLTGASALPAAAVEFGPAPSLSTVVFGSLEAGPGKTFAAIGLKRALGSDGLDASGFRLMVKAGGSREQAARTVPRGTLDKAEAQALVGYEWRIGDAFLSLYGGSDTESEQGRRAGALVAARTHYSGRIQADLWATPTSTTMVQGAAYLSGIDRRLWGRLAGGWSVRALAPAAPEFMQDAYLGPEAELFRQRDYTKLRVGAHLTGLRLIGLDWRISGGIEHQSRQGAQAYATLGLHWRR